MEWTPARKHSFIVSTLRAGSRRWPPKYTSLAKAFSGRKINKASGREAKHYLCAACKEDFPGSNVQVDHIVPVVNPTTGFTSWDSFIENLFCEEDNLQVLCIPCHKIKSKKEKDATKV